MANPPHDLGEAATLAAAEVTTDAIAIVDDQEARRVALTYGIEVHGGLWIAARAIDECRWNVSSVSAWCDTMLGTGIRWPFGVGGFTTWAVRTGLLVDPNR